VKAIKTLPTAMPLNCLHTAHHISQYCLIFCLYFSLFIASVSTCYCLSFASAVQRLRERLPFTLFFYSAQHNPSEETAVIKATRAGPSNSFHTPSVRRSSDLTYADGKPPLGAL